MATNYPGSLDSYTAKTDGVDVVMAAHINNLQDAIVAIETELGAAPSGADATVAITLGRVPSPGEKNALVGTEGTPGSANRYVTETDRTVKRDAVTFRDDFIGARDARWTLAGTGGTYTQNSELGGTGTLATGATNGNAAELSLNAKRFTDKGKNPLMFTRAKLSATTQVTAVLASLFNDSNNKFEIFYDSAAGANFKYRSKNAGTETVVDSGLAANTSYHIFEIDASAGDVVFKIDGANTQTVTTNLPTALMEPKISIATTENVDKQLTLDYVHLEADR